MFFKSLYVPCKTILEINEEYVFKASLRNTYLITYFKSYLERKFFYFSLKNSGTP